MKRCPPTTETQVVLRTILGAGVLGRCCLCALVRRRVRRRGLWMILAAQAAWEYRLRRWQHDRTLPVIAVNSHAGFREGCDRCEGVRVV